MDLISRQAAIDAVNKYTFDFPQYMERFVTELRDAMKGDLVSDLMELPSAQPNKEQIKTGEWEMFELITSVYYGKQYYFKRENGIVYSRASCKYMSVDDAIKEFLDVIGE